MRYSKRKPRVYRKRRGIKKRYSKRIPRRMSNPKIHNFKNYVQQNPITIPPGSAPVFATYTFSIANLSQITGFATLFDQYRIMAVKLTFQPAFNTYVAAGTAPYSIPTAYTVIDLDDSSTPTSINTLREFETCKIHNCSRWFSRYLKPRFSSPIYQSSTVTAYGLGPKNQWLDLAYQDIPYFALKVGIDNQSGSSVGMVIRVTAKYYVQFKSVR